jgi:hypothetical protein
LLLLFRKFIGKPFNKVCIKKALTKSLAFSSQKGLNSCPRTGFHAGTTCQSIPPPKFGSPNGSEGGKTICHSSYLSNFIPADLFPCRTVKMKLVSLSLSQESFKTSLEGVVGTNAKTSSPTPFSDIWPPGNVYPNPDQIICIKVIRPAHLFVITSRLCGSCMMVGRELLLEAIEPLCNHQVQGPSGAY